MLTALARTTVTAVCPNQDRILKCSTLNKNLEELQRQTLVME
jgi:hypothetical protein